MEKNYNKLVIILLLVFSVVFTIIGATFAYFVAAANADTNTINGSTYTFDIDLEVTAIRSGDLIPVADNLIADTLSSNNKCIDQRDYGLCSLYRLRFTNSGVAVPLVGYLKTSSGVTYTSSNLRYRLYELNGSTYTPVSDIGTISTTNEAINNFTYNSNNVTVTISANGTKDYYLVIWLHDTGSNQLEDQNKQYSGTLTFSSPTGGTISSNFIST